MPALLARRSLWLPALALAAGCMAVAVASLSPVQTLGQSSPSATAAVPVTPVASLSGGGASRQPAPGQAVTPAASPAPSIDNEVAVRAILPASIRDSTRLPVYKWARADIPDAPGGYVVFIAMMYPLRDRAGSVTDYSLVNYLQWDGAQWLLGAADYAGEVLRGDDIFLARNLNDITATRMASSRGQDYRTVGVTYSADGVVSSTLSRTETVSAIYDLTLTTLWSRVTTLREIDTSNRGYVLKHAQDVDATVRDTADGGSNLIAAVFDTVETVFTGDAPAGARLPPPGIVTVTTTELYVWDGSRYVLQPDAAPAG